MANLLLVLRPLALASPYLAPAGPVNTMSGFILAGGFLNAYWFVKILKMAMRGGGPKAQKKEE